MASAPTWGCLDRTLVYNVLGIQEFATAADVTGKINWVQIDLGTDDHDHFIDPEERLRIAMARQ